jgi:hypothetical protein
MSSFGIGLDPERKKNANLKRAKFKKDRKPKKFEKRRALRAAQEAAIAKSEAKKSKNIAA